MEIHAFLAKLQGVVQEKPGQWVALCPSHPDTRPSLAITVKEDKILLACRSHHCATQAIVDAAGLELRHLFLDADASRSGPRRRRRRQGRRCLRGRPRELASAFRLFDGDVEGVRP
jgi:hypothetical protein